MPPIDDATETMQPPLDVGVVVRRVFQVYVEEAPVLMPAAAVVFVFSGILSALLVAASPGLGLLGLLISLVATALFTGMVVQLVADVQDGRRDASAGDLLRAVMPVLGQLLVVSIVVAACVLIGIVLVVVPGLVLMTIWAVAVPVVVLERPPGLRPLGRSRELVRGNGWRVFGVILLLDILVIVLAAALQLAADTGGTGVGIVVRVVVGVLTAPLSALAAAVLYFELLRGESASGAPAAELGLPGGPS
jgi:hypothetical protein